MKLGVTSIFVKLWTKQLMIKGCAPRFKITEMKNYNQSQSENKTCHQADVDMSKSESNYNFNKNLTARARVNMSEIKTFFFTNTTNI